MPTISGVYAREILDSRGIPTVECTIWLDSGHLVKASAPSGTSKGKYEAVELRDGDQSHMNGQGVLMAVNNVNTIIAPQLIGKDPTQQTEHDQMMVDLDGTSNKSKLGANATIAVSMALLKAGAAASNLPLYEYIFQKYKMADEMVIPNCIYTLINGGEHGADNLDIQEFEILPASHIDFINSLNMSVTIFQTLEQVLIVKGAVHSVGLVGGYTPNLFNNIDAFEILVETIKATPYTFAQDLFFGTDMSASSFFESGKYVMKDKQQPYSSDELLDYYKAMRSNYHVFYIEDPFQEDDWKSWQKITADLGSTSLIAADGMLASSIDRIKKMIAENVANTAVLKPNSLGTVSETLQLFSMFKQNNWKIVVSHRSGDTTDDFIADFAVGLGADYVKFGPPNRGERIVKYNRLLEIYYQLQANQGQQATQNNQANEASNQQQNTETDSSSQ